MKVRQLLLLLISLVFFTPGFSSIKPCLELKPGYFFFSDSTLGKIYNHGGIDVQLSGAYPFVNRCGWKALAVYGSVEYLQRSGRSLSTSERTSIWELPISLGIQPIIAIRNWVHWYGTFGPRYFYVHQHTDSSYVNRIGKATSIGFFANTGFRFFPWKCLLLDLFGEYSYGQAKMIPSKPNVYANSIQIGGITCGGALGTVF